MTNRDLAIEFDRHVRILCLNTETKNKWGLNTFYALQADSFPSKEIKASEMLVAPQI